MHHDRHRHIRTAQTKCPFRISDIVHLFPVQIAQYFSRVRVLTVCPPPPGFFLTPKTCYFLHFTSILVGPSGSGKTTLLDLLGGRKTRSVGRQEGQIVIDGVSERGARGGGKGPTGSAYVMQASDIYGRGHHAYIFGYMYTLVPM